MKKTVFIIALIMCLFMIPGRAYAKTCKYYTSADFDDKKRPLVIQFSYDWNKDTKWTGKVDFTASNEYFKKKCDNATPFSNEAGTAIECDSSLETQNSLWNGNGTFQWGENLKAIALNIFIADETVGDDIFSDIYADKIACPPYILEYQEENKNFLDQGAAFFSYAFDELSLAFVKNDLPSFFTAHVKFTGYSSNYKKLYEESTEGPGSVNDNTCMSYDYYMNVLARLRDENNGSCENNEAFSKKYMKISDLCNAYRASALEYTASNENASDSSNSNVIVARACMTACSALRDDVSIICHSTEHDVTCNSLGAKIVDWLYKIIRIVRYGVPIMLIILSVMDFIRAMAADSEDEMKKASSRFGKRLLAAALVFLVPFVLDFILGMFNLPNLDNPFCTN